MIKISGFILLLVIIAIIVLLGIFEDSIRTHYVMYMLDKDDIHGLDRFEKILSNIYYYLYLSLGIPVLMLIIGMALNS